MNNTSIAALVIAVIVIIGAAVAWAVTRPAAPTVPADQGTQQQGSAASNPGGPDLIASTTTHVTSPAATVTTPAAQHFLVNGNDANADRTSITVKKGTPVSITFGADAGTTYHGGLDFRSSVVSTGTIAPGATKTVSFTADQSFSFTPYWPATNIAKPYKITVTVTP